MEYIDKIKNITNYDPTTLSDKVLVDDYRLMLAYYSKFKEDPDSVKFTRKQIKDTLTLIMQEMSDRDIEFHPEYYKKDSAEIFVEILEEILFPKGDLRKIQQPFGYPCGKWLQRNKFLKYLPSDCKVYVEPYVGGGAIFWSKDKHFRREVLNDLDKDVIDAYHFIKTMTEDEYKSLLIKSWEPSQDRFSKLLDSSPSNKVDKFYKFMYTNMYSFGRGRKTYSPRENGARQAEGRINRIYNSCRPRLKDVEILNKDGVEVIKQYDGSDVIFFIDPPYPGQVYGFVNDTSKGFDMDPLIDALHNIKGKFILTLDDAKEHREAFKKYNVYSHTVSNNANNIKGTRRSGTRRELVITNFKTKVKKVSQKERLEQLEETEGSWYLIEENGKPHSFVVQYHVRGIVHRIKDVKRIFEALKDNNLDKGKELLSDYLEELNPDSNTYEDLSKLLEEEDIQELFSGIFKKLEFVLIDKPLSAVSSSLQKVDDDRGNVSAALKKFVVTDPPKLGDLNLSKVYNIGNIHVDWRMKDPTHDYLVGITMDTVKISIQDIDDNIHYILRDRFLENKPDDNWLCQKKLRQPCVHGLTPIFTEHGFVAAKYLKIGDKVLTSNGKFKAIENVSKDNNGSPRYKIKTQYGIPVWFTGEHPLLTKDGWKNAEEITKGDFIHFPKIKFKENVPEVLLLKNQQNYSKEIPINSKFCEFLGYFLGDGSTSEKRRIFIFLGPDELDKALLLRDIISEIFQVGVTISDYRDLPKPKNQIVVTFTDKPLCKWLIDNCYHNSDNREKVLPAWLLNANNDMLSALVRGLINSDGCVLNNGNKLQFSNTSWKLAGQLVMILLKLGKIPSVIKKKQSVSIINDRKVNRQREIWDIRWWINKPSGCFNIEEDEDCYWFQVTSVEKLWQNKAVYNIEVADDHTFCVPFMSTHNTSWLNVVTPKDPVWNISPKTTGATIETAGRYFFMGSGHGYWGTSKSDFNEIWLFFDQKQYKNIDGRFDFKLIQTPKDFKKVPADAFWMMNRPHKSQVPYITTHDKDKEETKAKKDKIDMVWNEALLKAKELRRFKKVDKQTIYKVDKMKRVVIGAALIPNEPDYAGDVLSEDEIEKVAYNYMEDSQKAGLMHKGKSLDNVVLVESRILRKQEIHKTPFGTIVYPEGTWEVGFKIKDNKVWDQVLNGELTGFSIQGIGYRSKRS